MHLLFTAIAVLLGGAFLALAFERKPLLSTAVGVAAAVLGGIVGIAAAASALLNGRYESYVRPWSVPGGTLALGVDPLTCWFLIPVFVLTAVAAVYGAGYLWPERTRRHLGGAWACYNLLTAAMALVLMARNGVLFLVAWEVMSLSSYFLVVFDEDDEQVRRAGRIYLIATHLGTAFLLALFVLLGRRAGSMDFAAIAATPPGQASLLFLMAVVGFGTKAGFMPLHVWLPEAHPAAPSHVSAVMSGVMVKTGIYGLLRVLTLLPVPQAWWGWALIGIGAVSGIWGILHSIAQHDIKRLLAYSTVENIGIISLGMGVGVLGLAANHPIIALLGLSGAMLHVWNHALMKGALFLGAGAVAHATGTRRLDLLGGLAKRMPWLAGAMILASVAIVGLPPLNGFVGEFLIYLAAFRDDATLPDNWAIPGVFLVASLGLIGGLAAIAFSKLIGVAFLGEPRTEAASHAHSPGWLLTGPALLLAAGCVLIAAFAPEIVGRVLPIAGGFIRDRNALENGLMTQAHAPLSTIRLVEVIGLGLFCTLAAARLLLLRGREIGRVGTWDCGYAAPTARMQYTGSSLVGPVVNVFGEMLHVRQDFQQPQGLFPKPGEFETRPADVCLDDLYQPAFRGGASVLRGLSWIQQGTTQVYVLYITLTLLLLLVWQMGFA